MSSIIEKPDGTIVVTVRLTIRNPRIIEVIKHAPRRRLAATIVDLMTNGLQRQSTDDEEEDIDLSDMAIVL
jgi:hypothetical protein